MTLDPQARHALELAAAAGRPAVETLSPDAARRQYKEGRAAVVPPPAPVAWVENLSLPGPGGPIPVRHFRPVGSAAGAVLPALIWYHGGGWVMGDLDTHDGICRALANAAGAAVVSVDYRRPPEAKFPAAAEDAYAVLTWLAEHGDKLRIDRGRLAVGGDSAGGNLAAVAALAARERGGPALRHQVLVYPVTDFTRGHASYREHAEGVGLTAAAMAWFIDHYLNAAPETRDWRASPLHAPDHRGLPPALVITAGYDVLRDEGRAYAEALQRAGVQVVHRPFDGMIHGFLGMGRLIDAAAVATEEIGAALRRAFT
ncbi:alpha/beta hydrolase [Desertibaculum subflavum]|uniref:alpha/beta hydrolase n=1 Tax=Desertibaculum subflavum TaxID=2268458 RepID=UPI000E66A3DF